MIKYKIVSFLLVFILLTSNILAQENLNPNGYNTFYYPNGKKSSEGYLVNGKPDGYWKSYNEKGVLVSEGNRKNLLLDSVWVFYSPTAIKSVEITYKAGKKHGTRTIYSEQENTIEQFQNDTLIDFVRTFYKTGELKRLSPIVDGQMHGLEKEFDKSGVIICVSKYYLGIMSKREFVNKTDKFGSKQGAWKYFWKNGNLKEEGNYLNDKKKGFFKYYDEFGNFISVEKYDNDILIVDAPETRQLDVRTAYHANGKPSITATYFKGVQEGVRREFDENGIVIRGYVFTNGILKFEGITDVNGKRQGLWKEYYPSGELKSEGNYLNSNSIGKWKFYFQSQKKEIEGNYKNGKKNGEWVWYYANGEILQIENWSDGKLDGEFIGYDEIGNITIKGGYVDGTEEGEWLYIQGNATEKGTYYDGMRSKTWKIWNKEGILISEIEYEQDVPNGKYSIYYNSGKVKSAGKYSDGVAVGIWQNFSEDGELILTTVYKEGREVQWNDYTIEE